MLVQGSPLCAGFLLSAVIVAGGTPPPGETPRPVWKSGQEWPLAFERAPQSLAPAVDFVARGPGYLLGVGARGALIRGPSWQLEMRFEATAPPPRGEGRDQLPNPSHYFLGQDAAAWRSAVPNYRQVLYRELYPHTDLLY